jgi:GNAT superfamily N-acetyltransferase
MILEITKAQASDTDDLVDLHVGFRNSLGKSTPTKEQFWESIASILEYRNIVVVLARLERKAVGYASMHYFKSPWVSGYEAVLDDLFVCEANRSSGVGRKLVEQCIARAREDQVKTIHLDTNEKNTASNKLYEKLGFTASRARWAGGRQIRYDLSL